MVNENDPADPELLADNNGASNSDSKLAEVDENPTSNESASEDLQASETESAPVDTEIRDEDIASDDDFFDDDEDEDAAPIEEMLEESESASDDGDDDSSAPEMKWYILKVQVNREKSICDALRRRVKVEGKEEFFQDILVPEEKVRQFSKAGKSTVKPVKLYPGYIVVRMIITDDTWFLVRDTPGIGDFTGAAGRPAPLTQEEIDRIIATTKPVESEEEGEETVKTAIPFKVGERVRVKEGHFQNYEGEVSNVDDRNGRVTVMINIFNRPNPVELHHWQIEDI